MKSDFFVRPEISASLRSKIVNERRISSSSLIIVKQNSIIKSQVIPAILQMTVEDGDQDLLKPKVLKFNQYGLENIEGKRGAKDGIVHFGSNK